MEVDLKRGTGVVGLGEARGPLESSGDKALGRGEGLCGRERSGVGREGRAGRQRSPSMARGSAAVASRSARSPNSLPAGLPRKAGARVTR